MRLFLKNKHCTLLECRRHSRFLPFILLRFQDLFEAGFILGIRDDNLMQVTIGKCVLERLVQLQLPLMIRRLLLLLLWFVLLFLLGPVLIGETNAGKPVSLDTLQQPRR